MANFRSVVDKVKGTFVPQGPADRSDRIPQNNRIAVNIGMVAMEGKSMIVRDDIILI